MLSVTLYASNSWVVTAPTGDVGHSPVAGDTVANTGPGGSGTITGVTYGTNAFSTVRSALNAANAGNTVDILAGTYTFASPYQIGLDVTITGEQYDGGETLTGADGVFSISANVTINGGNNLTFSGAVGIGYPTGRATKAQRSCWKTLPPGPRLPEAPFRQRDGNRGCRRRKLIHVQRRQLHGQSGRRRHCR